jgi:hypothetical protein
MKMKMKMRADEMRPGLNGLAAGHAAPAHLDDVRAAGLFLRGREG